MDQFNELGLDYDEEPDLNEDGSIMSAYLDNAAARAYQFLHPPAPVTPVGQKNQGKEPSHKSKRLNVWKVISYIFGLEELKLQ